MPLGAEAFDAAFFQSRWKVEQPAMASRRKASGRLRRRLNHGIAVRFIIRLRGGKFGGNTYLPPGLVNFLCNALHDGAASYTGHEDLTSDYRKACLKSSTSLASENVKSEVVRERLRRPLHRSNGYDGVIGT